MGIKKIIKVWNEGGLVDDNIEFLLKETKNIYFPLTSSSEKIIEDLHEAYKEIPCAGIAANQIGYDKSIFIGLKDYNDDLDVDDIEEKERKHDENSLEKNDNADNFEVYINPQIDKIDEKDVPKNLCLRVSAVKVDSQPPSFWKWTSGVHKDKKAIGRECPAYKQDGECGSCRACWSRKVKQVSYKEH